MCVLRGIYSGGNSFGHRPAGVHEELSQCKTALHLSCVSCGVSPLSQCLELPCCKNGRVSVTFRLLRSLSRGKACIGIAIGCVIPHSKEHSNN